MRPKVVPASVEMLWDERKVGQPTSPGIELCAVVESMFSYEQIEAGLGDPIFAERLTSGIGQSHRGSRRPLSFF